MARISFFSFLTFCFLSAAGHAQDGAAGSTPDVFERFKSVAAKDENSMRFARQLAAQLKRQKVLDVLKTLYSRFYRIAPDGNLTFESLDHAERANNAKQRALMISQYLTWDLDGDAALDGKERALVDPTKKADIEVLFLQADKDSDGRINTQEMVAFAQSQLETRQRMGPNPPFLVFDADGNGTVTSAEVAETVRAIASHPDAIDEFLQQQLNLRATTSRDTSPVVTELARRGLLQDSKNKATCKAPKPSPESQLVVLSGYDGAALSSVSVVGMNDVTNVSRLIFEDGMTPIFLYLTSHENAIWEISGATKRIEHLVVQKGSGTDGAGAGVIGIDEERITFSERVSCSPAYMKVSGGEGVVSYGKVSKKLGRAPDVMLHSYTIGTMLVPSGKQSENMQGEGTDLLILNGRNYELTPEGPRLLDDTTGQFPDSGVFGANRVYASMKRFAPAGVYVIDPETVVAPEPVEPYDVLPQEAGLLQLVLEEKLRVTRDGFFIIEKPIDRFPAGLAGAHSVRFILADGVEMPRGSLGHSSIYSAATGECLIKHCLR